MKIFDYIKGDRRGRDAHRTEVEAMRDPLLHDAIEGFDAADGDHERVVERLQERVRVRVAAKTDGVAGTRRPRRNLNRWATVAAVVLLAVATGGLYMIMRGQGEVPVTMAQESGEGLPEFRTIDVETLRVIAQPPAAGVQTEVAAGEVADAGMAMDVMAVAETASEEEAAFEEVVVVEETMVATRAEGSASARTQAVRQKMSRVKENAYAAERDVSGLQDIPVAELDSLTAVRSFEDFLNNSRVVARDAVGMRVSGVAVAEITADGRGYPRDIHIVESPDPAATREIKRLIRRAPAWPDSRTIRVVIEF